MFNVVEKKNADLGEKQNKRHGRRRPCRRVALAWPKSVSAMAVAIRRVERLQARGDAVCRWRWGEWARWLAHSTRLYISDVVASSARV
jgi:hypothetical protein